MKAFFRAAALVACILVPAGASALPIAIASATGLDGLGSFTGTIDYDPVLAELELYLENTSPAGNGGKLVAFAFNNPANLITDVALTSKNANFSRCGGAGADDFQNDIKVQPFGYADIGASISGQWEGGGSPNNGLGVGSFATFTFKFTGSGLSALTIDDFLSAVTTKQDQWLAVRFKGFNNGGSDKVGALVPDPDVNINQVPEPASLLLLGGGMIGLVAVRRRMQKRS